MINDIKNERQYRSNNIIPQRRDGSKSKFNFPAPIYSQRQVIQEDKNVWSQVGSKLESQLDLKLGY